MNKLSEIIRRKVVAIIGREIVRELEERIELQRLLIEKLEGDIQRAYVNGIIEGRFIASMEGKGGDK